MSISVSSADGATSSSSQAAEQAKLNQMMAQYRGELKTGSSQTLASLGKQISAEAKTLGQNVVLPTASNAASTPATPPPPAAGGSAVSITA
jgi:hypothetical protein